MRRPGATVKKVPEADVLPQGDVEPRFDFSQTIETLVSSNSVVVRGFTLAMLKSAIIATRRIASLAKLNFSLVEPLENEQMQFLRRLDHVTHSKFLVYEA